MLHEAGPAEFLDLQRERLAEPAARPALPSVAAVTRKAGRASPTMAPRALKSRGGAPRNRTGSQLAQKMAYAAIRKDATGWWPMNDLKGPGRLAG